MASGERPVRGRNLLLTFDDGFASNRVAAEEVLGPMGIRALFFIVSDFAACVDRGQARAFISDRIQPIGIAPNDLPTDWHNMQWADLEALLEQGHTIGAHTRTHPVLSRIGDDATLTAEIAGSADVIESRLGVRIEHFAYPFGTSASFSPAAMAVARRRFRFVHSGARGDNRGASPFAIRRDAAATQDPHPVYRSFSPHLLGAFLEGAADLRYSRDRDQLDQWARC